MPSHIIEPMDFPYLRLPDGRLADALRLGPLWTALKQIDGFRDRIDATMPKDELLRLYEKFVEETKATAIKSYNPGDQMIKAMVAENHKD